MFDPATVIATVRQGQYSPDWRVFPGKSNLGCAIGIAVFLLCFGVIFGGMLGMGSGIIGAVISVPTLSSSSTLPSSFQDMIFNIGGIGLVVALIVGGLFIVGAVWIVLRSLALGRSLLVLLPEGVVECYQGKMDKITTLDFSKIQKMNMDKQTIVNSSSEGTTSSRTNYWLNVYDEWGRYVKWNIRAGYEDPVVIAGNIVAAFEHYQRESSRA